MTRKVWIIGPVAIDTVAYIEKLPVVGSFTRPSRIVKRIGGSSGNVALALAAAGVETGFISYIGNDAHGFQIKEHFTTSGISDLHLQEIVGESNHALVMVDASGDRTIVALTDSHLAEISLEQITFASDDIVVFSLWRPFFIEHLRYVQSLGCMTIVGLEALHDPAVQSADCAIGSEAELGEAEVSEHIDRFPRIVVTRGAGGCDEYQAGSLRHQEAITVDVLDTTGAGDSFLAGFLTILARGELEVGSATGYGARWAAATVAIEGSTPATPPL